MARPDPAVLLGREIRLWLGEGRDNINMLAVRRAMLAEAKEAGGDLWTYPSRLRFHGYAERLVIYNRAAAERLREAGEVQGKRFLSVSLRPCYQPGPTRSMNLTKCRVKLFPLRQPARDRKPLRFPRPPAPAFLPPISADSSPFFLPKGKTYRVPQKRPIRPSR